VGNLQNSTHKRNSDSVVIADVHASHFLYEIHDDGNQKIDKKEILTERTTTRKKITPFLRLDGNEEIDKKDHNGKDNDEYR